MDCHSHKLCSNIESCTIPSNDIHCKTTAKLLGLNENALRKWLCKKEITAQGEDITIPMSKSQASFARDALAKHIYSTVFEWIVTRINSAQT
jgi:myosin-5